MVKINKIMLSLPNNRWTDSKQWNTFPYTFGILTGILKDRYDVKILDAGFYNLSKNEVKNQIADYKPDVFGVSCLSLENDEDFRRITSLAKESCPEAKIIVGGIYPTLLPERIMQNKDIDYAVLGEGEYRFPKLLENIEKGKSMEKIDGLAYRLNDNLIIQKVENYIQNLDNFFPCYDNLNFSDYSHHKNKKSPYIMPRRLPYAETISSRGCPNNCIFCSSNAINGRKIRARSADSILKEIDWLVKKYGIKELIFLDDNFHFNRKRVKEILAGLIKRSYDLEWKTTNSQISLWNDELLELVKESGCYQLSIAPECGSIEQLELIRKPSPKKTFLNAKPIVKKAKELGMNTIGSFIIGIPGETWDQIKQTSKYAEELDLDYCAFNIATPLPKTELYYNCKKNKLIPKEFGFNNLGFKGFGIPNITTNEFTPSELLMFRIMEWDRINFSSPEKIKRVAEVNGLTIDEIEEWRKDTRRGIEIKLK